MKKTRNSASSGLLCSDCFVDEGLRIDAYKNGLDEKSECPQCKSTNGRKLTKNDVTDLAWRFFVSGTILRGDYGGAPAIQFNEHHYGNSDISPSPWLSGDIKIEEAARIGFFHYGHRLWMVGEVERLKDLEDPAKRTQVIARILEEYPRKTLAEGSAFYRLRIAPR